MVKYKQLVVLITLALTGFTACNSSQKKATKPADEQSFTAEQVLYISSDGQHKFAVEEVSNEQIKIMDLISDEVYLLEHVPSASGVKYSNENGYSFWIKGDNFMWMKGEMKVASGERVGIDFSGNYVTTGYEKRKEGYDWVGVKVTRAGSDKLKFQVRSRADKKKPTCTWDAVGYQLTDNSYYTMEDGKRILFNFLGDTLSIAPEHPADENVLFFYCSGGATVAGQYIKIEEKLDQEQIDPTIFSKVLRLQGIGFYVTSVRKGPQTEVTVSPFGLEEVNRVETYTVDGSVVDAEVEDLNADGSPELLIYTQSFGSGSYGNVLAFSVNNRKSLSRAYFPPVVENPSINKGYMGHDEFSVVETSLVQRFPVYNEGDPNARPTGGIRQISYKLVEGEAMRRFEVKDIMTLER